MSKVFGLRDWVPLDKAANHLATTLGEDITVEDLLALASERRLSLSWRLRSKPGLRLSEVEPPKNPQTPVTYDYETTEVSSLRGAYRIKLSSAPEPISDAWFAYLNGEADSRPACGTGVPLVDDDGEEWRVLEYRSAHRNNIAIFGPNDPKPRLKSTREGLYLKQAFPDLSDLCVRQKDLEAFLTDIKGGKAHELELALPKKRDGWADCIGDAATEFRGICGRYPKKEELWGRLIEDPPGGYDLEVELKIGKKVLRMGDKSLDEEAFGKRYGRYFRRHTDSKRTISGQ